MKIVFQRLHGHFKTGKQKTKNKNNKKPTKKCTCKETAKEMGPLCGQGGIIKLEKIGLWKPRVY